MLLSTALIRPLAGVGCNACTAWLVAAWLGSGLFVDMVAGVLAGGVLVLALLLRNHPLPACRAGGELLFCVLWDFRTVPDFFCRLVFADLDPSFRSWEFNSYFLRCLNRGACSVSGQDSAALCNAVACCATLWCFVMCCVMQC